MSSNKEGYAIVSTTFIGIYNMCLDSISDGPHVKFLLSLPLSLLHAKSNSQSLQLSLTFSFTLSRCSSLKSVNFDSFFKDPCNYVSQLLSSNYHVNFKWYWLFSKSICYHCLRLERALLMHPLLLSVGH